MDTQTQELPRRTIVKSAAWALPVIAAVVATPMAAASEHPQPVDSPFMLRWYTTEANKKPAASGGIEGLVEVGSVWDNEGPITVTIIVTVAELADKVLLNETHVLTPNGQTKVIPFANTTPVQAGKTYTVVFTIIATDASGRKVTKIGTTHGGAFIQQNPVLKSVSVNR